MKQEQKQIRDEMLRYGASIEVATFVAAQATLESGNFESHIYKENNNFLGMKQAKCRITRATGSNRGHAYYQFRIECIIDYVLWLTSNGFTQNTLKDLDRFKARLGNSGYCPLKDYIKRIEAIYEQIKDN